MKLVECISKKLFIRTNNGTGYDVVIEGDYDVVMEGDINFLYNLIDDKINVFVGDDKLDTINVRDAAKTPYIKSYIDLGVNASIFVMRA